MSGIMQMQMGGSVGGSLIDIITSLGLTTNLKLCLDAGDSASYNPAVQTAKWLDTSGGGYDFYRGASGVGDAAEPTFNGSAGGLSSSEYFSADGISDKFEYDAANETWMQNLHKDNAIFSFLAVLYGTTFSGSNRLFSTNASTTGIGVNFGTLVTGGSAKIRVRVANGTGVTLDVNSTTPVGTAWMILQGSLNETTGAGGLLLKVSANAAESFTSTYPSPSALNSSDTASIFGSGSAPGWEADSRLACLAIWEGAAHPEVDMNSLYDATKGRFGL